jgi:hypothetical protein
MSFRWPRYPMTLWNPGNITITKTSILSHLVTLQHAVLRSTCPAHGTLLYLIIGTMLGEYYGLLKYLLCSFLQSCYFTLSSNMSIVMSFQDKSKPSKKPARSRQQAEQELLISLLPAGCLLGLLFRPEDGGNLFLRNIGSVSQDSTAVLQKMELFIATAVRTSNPKYRYSLRNYILDGTNMGPTPCRISELCLNYIHVCCTNMAMVRIRCAHTCTYTFNFYLRWRTV